MSVVNHHVRKKNNAAVVNFWTPLDMHHVHNEHMAVWDLIPVFPYETELNSS